MHTADLVEKALKVQRHEKPVEQPDNHAVDRSAVVLHRLEQLHVRRNDVVRREALGTARTPIAATVRTTGFGKVRMPTEK